MLGVLGGWLLHDALAAKGQLQTVRDDVHRLRTQIDSGDLAGAKLTAADIAQHARAAHDDTTGPLWAIGANVPYLGRPLDDERTIAAAVDGVARAALPSLVEASTVLDPKTLRRPDGSINVAPLVQESGTLSTAAAQLRTALAQITHLPASSWLSAADRARSDLIGELAPLSATITDADVAAATVPTLLGEYGPKNYMITFENEAELRGGGGLPGAFAIMHADRGKLTFTTFEPDTELVDVPSGLDLGPVFAQTFQSPDSTNDYRDSNVSPHFPYAAQIWLAEWQMKTGQHLDGAMALDPTALSYLLGVTGAATLPDGSQVTGDNVVARTERDPYSIFTQAQTAQRKAFLLDVARSVSTRLVSANGDFVALVRAAGRAASEHRLLVWTTDPAIESRLAPTSISGVVPGTAAPFAAVAINNAGANKLDYYLHATASWVGHGCGSGRTATVTVTLRNDAPTGLSANALGFTGQPGYPQNPGDNRLLVTLYGTAGGSFSSVQVNGVDTGATPGTDQGHPTYTVEFLIGRATTTTVTYTLVDPGSQVPHLWLQPMVNPMTGSASERC